MSRSFLYHDVFVCTAYEFARKCTSSLRFDPPNLLSCGHSDSQTSCLQTQSPVTLLRTLARVRASPIQTLDDHTKRTQHADPCLLCHRGHPRGLSSRASAIVCSKSTTDNTHCHPRVQVTARRFCLVAAGNTATPLLSQCSKHSTRRLTSPLLCNVCAVQITRSCPQSRKTPSACSAPLPTSHSPPVLVLIVVRRNHP